MGNLSILTIVVIGLVLALLVDFVGFVILSLQGNNIPGVMENGGLMIITGLLGLLAPSKTVTANN